ncbi:Hsp20/alpha crystallin family protein [Patescibacteria group bacterium]|nr:Hsp20/alpha crystallin family protein [Patescibacteria group bacterium]
MENKKRSFFERLTGSVSSEEEIASGKHYSEKNTRGNNGDKKNNEWIEEENEEAELSIDVYQTPTDIVIQTMVAGVKPEDLELSIARDIVTIRGKREENRNIDEENYFTKELYWGKFSRTISLPTEVEPEEVEATEKHGLITVKIKKVDKEKKNSVKVKSI